MRQLTTRGFAALLICCTLGVAHSQSIPTAVTVGTPETQLVATSTAAPPSQETFTIAAAEDLVVTLTDLGLPTYQGGTNPLTSANVVVTQAGVIVGSAQMTAPSAAATAPPATLSIAGASGTYALYVFGVPNANSNVGTFSVCVAPKSTPANCIPSASFSGNITVQSSAQSPTVSTVDTTLTATTTGTYTVTLTDLQFPVALNVASTPASATLYQGSAIVDLPGTSTPAIITAGTPVSVTLTAGETYTLLGIAQADATAQAGLYSIVVTDPSGATIFSEAEPVGLLTPSSPIGSCVSTTSIGPLCTFDNLSAQMLTLSVVDYAFPAALNSASALLMSGGQVLGSATSGGGAVTFTAPAGGLTLWTYGASGSSGGTYSVDVAAGTSDLYTTALGVDPVGSTSTFAYAYVVPVSQGNYQVSAADLQFPSTLSGLSFAVAQDGAILQQSTTGTTLKVSPAAGNLVLLASAQPPASGSTTSYGLFDINVQLVGGNVSAAQLVYDKTQAVNSAAGGLFGTQSLSVTTDASYQVTLTDLKFPAAFSSLALVVSQGANVLGKIYGGGPFAFTGTSGTYKLTFVAAPGTGQSFGLYSTSVALTPPTATLTSSVSTATTGSSITLTWTAANATTCTASGGNFTGSVSATGGTQSVTLAATTTYSLTCTGPGGSVTATASVTATPAKSGGGGGALDGFWLCMLTGVLSIVAFRRVAQLEP